MATVQLLDFGSAAHVSSNSKTIEPRRIVCVQKRKGKNRRTRRRNCATWESRAGRLGFDGAGFVRQAKEQSTVPTPHCDSPKTIRRRYINILPLDTGVRREYLIL